MALGDFLFHDGFCRFFQLYRFGAAVVLLDDGPGAEQAAEEQVAAQLAVVMADGNDDAAQAVFGRGGRRETAVVGADVADGISNNFQNLSKIEFSRQICRRCGLTTDSRRIKGRACRVFIEVKEGDS